MATPSHATCPLSCNIGCTNQRMIFPRTSRPLGRHNCGRRRSIAHVHVDRDDYFPVWSDTSFPENSLHLSSVTWPQYAHVDDAVATSSEAPMLPLLLNTSTYVCKRRNRFPHGYPMQHYRAYCLHWSRDWRSNVRFQDWTISRGIDNLV